MIKYNELRKLIETGYDIEFSYKGYEYSIISAKDKNEKTIISFCKFYNEPVDFQSIDDFMSNAKIDDVYLKDIWSTVSDILY